ncbi:ABC transporter, ATP-binding protein, partial [Pseudomonas syringae pv. antirrhini]
MEDVTLQLNENEIVGLLGRSGSGKSTLLRSIAGLVVPTEGEVNFPRRVQGRAMSVGMVFQSFALFPWLTVLENVEVGLEAQRVPAAVRRKRALAAID